jgi:hypothetical protein
MQILRLFGQEVEPFDQIAGRGTDDGEDPLAALLTGV